MAGSASLAFPRTAEAAEHAAFLNAPAALNSPTPKFAGQFQLALQLPEGKGLARALLDAGVTKEDAAAAARLAAGHLGAGDGGCHARISIERGAAGGFSLMRVQLTTAAREAVIERRGSELTIASDIAISGSPALV